MPRGPTSAPTVPDSLHSLVPLIYEAGVDPKIWRRALALLSEAIRAKYCELLITPSAGVLPLVRFKSGAQPRPRIQGEGHRTCSNGPPLCRAHHASVAIALRGRKERAILRALRDCREPPFGSAERDHLKRISPHVGRSLQLYAQLQEAEAKKSALRAIVNALPIGVLWVDAMGRLLDTNEPGREILESGKVVRVVQNRVELSDPAQDQQLREALGRASGEEESGSTPAMRQAFRVPREAGRAPLYLRVVPLARKSVPSLREPTALIAVSDPERPLLFPLEQLMQQYDLTAAQARVASMLVSGMSVDQVAHHTDRSPSTIRTELKQVFARTGARRQSELVRMLLTGPLVFRSRPSQ